MIRFQAIEVVRQKEIQPDVTIDVVVHRPNDGHEARLIRRGVEAVMILPVQFAPRREIGFVCESFFAGVENFLRAREIFRRHARNGPFQNSRLENATELDELFDFLRRESGHDGAVVRD
ncbi:MAG: hypothetical protein WBL70_20425 [Candidatus Acidiferrales bacterium]